MNEPGTSPRPRRRRLRWFLRQVEHCLALIGLGTIVYCTCFSLSRITSGSMKPTLRGENWQTGDLVLTERISYWLRRPRRWEVITFQGNEQGQVMKRVIGLPGEHVQMLRGGRIFIDDQEIFPPEKLDFLAYFPFGNLIQDGVVACGDGYYVLGDDSRDSDDSRFNGPVLPERLIGRSWLILAPGGHRGFVNP